MVLEIEMGCYFDILCLVLVFFDGDNVWVLSESWCGIISGFVWVCIGFIMGVKIGFWVLGVLLLMSRNNWM